MSAILRVKIIVAMIFNFAFGSSYGQNIEQHRWSNRILIVKTQGVELKKYEVQLKEFEDTIAEMIERKLILYKVSKQDFVLTNYENREFNTSGKVSKRLADSVLNEHDDFEVILIGLDGQIKLQQTEVLTKEDLFTTIDAMPMRKSEMRN